MNSELEIIVVKTFFEKRIQERVLFELSSPKKRKDAIGRLNHQYKQTLNENYMIEIPKPNSNYLHIANLLKNYGAGDYCYVISWSDSIDTQELPLTTALEKAVGLGMPTLISCIPNKLIYFEAEQEFGSPPRYILSKK
ncbi:hypothetical protein H1230_19925 [Paenibacillus sp. 19GGS1-52]|uniref:hypothetical protein n=1 Tax=Paenibacillus sp. 19GGS1-52 TaxID=2758563 RepID=UPI001EFB57BB|nr:hypothetical protein [Paenibacillus sp. 19GGS1-52]ULO05358.1 hypothetical protein H1230_19925 [Paenibacillus sp. 19GGS1-52]